MKANELKESLLSKYPNRENTVKQNFNEFKINKNDNLNTFNTSKLLVSNNSSILNQNKTLSNNQDYNLDDLVIIGVSGSKGKSSVCKMIHEYLKSVGKKSILYSSVEIDSFASIKANNVACERAIKSEETLLDILLEAEVYKSEYLVLEINDVIINKGLIKDIPFDIRVLTNIHKKNSKELFSDDEYFKLKKSFIKDINENDNCKCIIGMCDQYKLEDYNDLIRSCKKEVITYGTKFLCDVWNVSDSNLDYMIYGDHTSKMNSLKGINFKLRMKDNIYDIKSNSIFSFSSLNILSVVSVLDTLNLFDVNKFNDLLNTINIDGRDELIYSNGRYFLIGISLMPHLELLNRMKENKEFNKLKVITASMGLGFKTWDKEFNSDLRISKLEGIRRQAMLYTKKYADLVYLTSNDPAQSSKEEIIKELKSYFDDLNKVKVNIERIDAIKQAINESEVGDLIYISGRGNRNVFCNTSDEMLIFTDKEILINELKNKGWM